MATPVIKNYAYIKASEDGRPFNVMTAKELKEFLDNPRNYCGITRFRDVQQFNTDPQEWPEGDGVLISFEVITPRKTDGWII